MRPINRVLVFVLDGVGAGEAPDAAAYGDKGSNSLSNTAKAVGGLKHRIYRHWDLAISPR